MRKIIKLTESDLTRIVRRVIRENEGDIEEPYYTKSHGDPLEFYKNGMMQFALSVNLDDVPEVDWLRRKLDALTNEAEGKLSEEELRKLMSYRNKEIEHYIRGEEKRFRDDMNENEDIDRHLRNNEDIDRIDRLLQNIVRGFRTEDPKDFTEIISDISDLIEDSKDVNDFKMKIKKYTKNNQEDFNKLTDDEKNQLDGFINSTITRHDFN